MSPERKLALIEVEMRRFSEDGHALSVQTHLDRVSRILNFPGEPSSLELGCG